MSKIEQCLDYFENENKWESVIANKKVPSRGSVTFTSQLGDGKTFLPVNFNNIYGAPFTISGSNIKYNDPYESNLKMNIWYNGNMKPKFYLYKNTQIISFGSLPVTTISQPFMNGETLMLSILLDKGTTINGSILFSEKY